MKTDLTELHAALGEFNAWWKKHGGEWDGYPPYLSTASMCCEVLLMCDSPEQMATATRIVMTGAAIGDVRKEANDHSFDVWRPFGRMRLRAWAPRSEVCEAVVVGTETVEVPDPTAPMVTIERDVIEWRCEPVLSAS